MAVAVWPRNICHVNHLYDISVIGAGPSGSYAAFLLATAGYRVLLIDRRRIEEIAPVCTGVVGRPYAVLMDLEPDLVLAEAKAATVVSPSGSRLRVASTDVQAYVLDRTLLEKRLRHKAATAGAEVLDGVVISRMVRESDIWVISGSRDGCREMFASRAVVLAAGVSPGLARQSGVGSPRRYLVGGHVEVEMDDVPETEVHLVPDLAPGAFAWLTPVGPYRVRVGVLSMRAAMHLTERFLDRPDVSRRLRSHPVLVAQRPIPVAPSRWTCSHGLVSIGDAAGQVKPTTGGGLYFGALAAQAATEVLGEALSKDDLSLNSLASYERLWRSAIGRELHRGALLRSLYTRMSPGQVDRLIGWAGRTRLADRILGSTSFSFDRHSGTFFSALLQSLPAALSGATPPRVEAE